MRRCRGAHQTPSASVQRPARRGHWTRINLFAWSLVLHCLLAGACADAAQYAYVANQGQNAILGIDVAAGAVVNVIPVDSPSYIALNPAGTRLYVSSSGSLAVFVVDTATNGVVATIPVPGVPGKIVVNASGTRAYVLAQRAGAPGMVLVLDTKTNSIASTIPLPFSPRTFAVSPAETVLYVTDSPTFADESMTRGTYVIDIATHAIVALIPQLHPDRRWTNDAVLSPDGMRLYIASQ